MENEVDEIISKFQRYCHDPIMAINLSAAAVAYIRQCIREAHETAQEKGRVLDIYDHSLFDLMVIETRRPDLVAPFLIAGVKKFDSRTKT